MSFLTDEEIAAFCPAQAAMVPSPIPARVVSSDEFAPIPQTAQQREVEARIKSMADEIAAEQNRSRRGFLAAASGTAAAFLAMNEVHGRVFGVSRAEAAKPERAEARAASLRNQFIMDVRTQPPAPRHPPPGLRGNARDRRSRRLRLRAEHRRAEPRQPEIREPVQGGRPRRRHRGRAHLRRAVGRTDRLLPHQPDGVQRAPADGRGDRRHVSLHEPRDLRPRTAGPDGLGGARHRGTEA